MPPEAGSSCVLFVTEIPHLAGEGWTTTLVSDPPHAATAHPAVSNAAVRAERVETRGLHVIAIPQNDGNRVAKEQIKTALCKLPDVNSFGIRRGRDATSSGPLRRVTGLRQTAAHGELPAEDAPAISNVGPSSPTSARENRQKLVRTAHDLRHPSASEGTVVVRGGAIGRWAS